MSDRIFKFFNSNFRLSNGQFPSYINFHSALDLYSPIELIGSGSYAIIHKARHNKTDQIVALKEMEPRSDYDLKAVKSEIKFYTNILPHDSLPEFFGTYFTDKKVWLVIEFIKGKTLKSYLCDEVIDELKFLGIIKTLTLGIDHIHKSGYAHKNLYNLENMIVTENGNIKIIDFGLSVADSTIIEQNDDLGVYSYILRKFDFGQSPFLKNKIEGFSRKTIDLIELLKSKNDKILTKDILDMDAIKSALHLKDIITKES